jgi:hypothetical protein
MRSPDRVIAEVDLLADDDSVFTSHRSVSQAPAATALPWCRRGRPGRRRSQPQRGWPACRRSAPCFDDNSSLARGGPFRSKGRCIDLCPQPFVIPGVPAPHRRMPWQGPVSGTKNDVKDPSLSLTQAPGPAANYSRHPARVRDIRNVAAATNRGD